MKPTRFDPSRDLAPLPFGQALCRKALELKTAGLNWIPQVGCFVWDPEETIPAPSPFGQRIYFVLNLNRFLQFYESIETMKEKLVWLPTWYQARLLLRRRGEGSNGPPPPPGLTDEKEYLQLYDRLLGALGDSSDSGPTYGS
jgi:hypothetical protein